MLPTYKAVLRDDRVEWIDLPPGRKGPLPVHVTILEESHEHPSVKRGRDMADALEALESLEALAALGGVSSIADPSAWQREVREERPLPGRNG